VIEETVFIFRNKKPKNLNFWVFLGFLNVKTYVFKSGFNSPGSSSSSSSDVNAIFVFVLTVTLTLHCTNYPIA